MNEIIPGLFLGSRKSSENKFWIQTNQIQTIINCTTTVDFNQNTTNNIRVPVEDKLNHEDFKKLYKYLPKITDLIHRELKQMKPVLVHCYAGKQRSAAVVAAYLIKYAKMTLISAIKAIKTKRPVAFTPNVNFLKVLQLYEKNQKTN